MKLKFQQRNAVDRHFKNGSSKYLRHTFISDQKQKKTEQERLLYRSETDWKKEKDTEETQEVKEGSKHANKCLVFV